MVALIMMLVYVVGTTLISVIFAKKQAKKQADAKEFLVASGGLGAVLIIPLLFAEMIGGTGTIGAAQTGYTTGVYGVWATWGMTAGCIFFLVFVQKFYLTMHKKNGAASVPEAYGQFFDQKTRIVSLVITALVFTIFYALQPTAAASIISPMLGIDKELCSWICAAIFILVTVLGGMKGVAWMNFVHAVIMYVFIGIVCFKSIHSVGGMEMLTSTLPSTYFDLGHPSWGSAIAILIGTAFSYLASPTCGNATFSAKNMKSARGGILSAAILVMPFALMVVFIGIAAKVALPDIPSANALFSMANLQGTVFGGLVSMAIMAAIWSTAPAMLLVVSGTITRDLYKGFIKKDATDKEQIRFSRIAIVVIAIVATFFGNHASSLLAQMTAAFQIRSIVGIVLAIALLWPRVTSTAAFWSTLIGGALAAIWHFVGQPFGIAPLWPSAILGVIVLVVLTFATGKEKVSPGYKRYKEALAQMTDEDYGRKPKVKA